MWNNIEIDRHFTGTFNLAGDKLLGEIIYNKSSGVIVLNINIATNDKDPFGKTYGDIDVINGVLNSGETVTLFKNRCIKRKTRVFHSQQVQYLSKYMIWGNKSCESLKFDKLVSVLNNALSWSGLAPFDFNFDEGLKRNPNYETKEFHWFGAKIEFSTQLRGMPLIPKEEEINIEQRLVLTIEIPEKESIEEFLDIRRKAISLISFGIKDNVNVLEQYFVDSDDYYEYENGYKQYSKFSLFASEPYLDTYYTYEFDYNFKLTQLNQGENLSEKLTLLAPVFNLYLSLFKYKDMPMEMVFLNIVQAIETFHARFFYDDKKEKFIQSVEDRFSNFCDYNRIRTQLLSDAQMNSRHIILASRINDLLVGKYNGLFHKYYITDEHYAQKIVDTRNYLTHYDKDKEQKALKGKELGDAIYVLRLLLEYNICLQLGVDNQDKMRIYLNRIQISEEINKTMK